MRYFILFVLVGILLVSCEKDTPPIDNNNSTNGLDQQILLDLVNDARTSGCTCGSTTYPPVGSVVWDTQLAAAAQMHSDDMDANKFLAHTGSDGSSPRDRLDNVGVVSSSYGENIANGYSSESGVIQAWLNSSGHCSNIMSSSKKRMGVAQKGTYWVQIFTD